MVRSQARLGEYPPFDYGCRPGSTGYCKPVFRVYKAIALGLLVVGALAFAGCNLSDRETSITELTKDEPTDDFKRGSGSPALATKNTVRIPGSGPIANAAGAALAVYPSTSIETRPNAVSLVGKNDWRAAVIAGVFMSQPTGAPILLGDRDEVSDITQSALSVMRPVGARLPDQPQVLALGDVKLPDGVRATQVRGRNAPELAASVDLLHSRINRGRSRDLIVVSTESIAAGYAAVAGPLAAKTNSPVLFVGKQLIPRATLRALSLRNRKAQIHVIGPPAVVSETVLRRLRRYGSVNRIAGMNVVENAIAAAIYQDESGWGWGITDPGHGFIIARRDQVMDVAAATALSVSGAYGPLLFNDSGKTLSTALRNYLLDIKPGYVDDPTRGSYNRAWLLGGEETISSDVQAQIDALCEIVPVKIGAQPGQIG